MRALFTVAAAAALVAGFAPAVGADAGESCRGSLTLQPIRTDDTTRRFAGVRAIIVRNESGDVAVDRSPAARTTVATEACFSGPRPALSQRVRSGVLTISASCPRPLAPLSISVLEGPCRRDIQINAPAAVSPDLRTNVGDLSAEGIGGATVLRAAAGDVSATRSRARSIRISSLAGSLDVGSQSKPRLIEANGGAGKVSVTVPIDRYAVQASSSAGVVRSTGLTSDPSAARKIEATTQSGDVTLTGLKGP